MGSRYVRATLLCLGEPKSAQEKINKKKNGRKGKRAEGKFARPRRGEVEIEKLRQLRVASVFDIYLYLTVFWFASGSKLKNIIVDGLIYCSTHRPQSCYCEFISIMQNHHHTPSTHWGVMVLDIDW